MAEPVERWWARRRFSRGVDVPYPVGTYRAAWSSFPALIRQYHPDLNAGITLTQIPPAAEVLLQWQCEVGHVFVATPSEQRSRPGRERRRSSWCPECSAGARGRVIPTMTSAARMAAWSDRADRPRRPLRTLCTRTPDADVGTAFTSECAPRRASAAEAELDAGLRERLDAVSPHNAVRLRQPFFDHLEAWPDLLLADLRVAVEYDTTGRHGLEHVGPREESDRRKDRLLRQAGWEVVRVRTGRLPRLGEFDVTASGPGQAAVRGVLDSLRRIRGDLLVDAYLRG